MNCYILILDGIVDSFPVAVAATHGDAVREAAAFGITKDTTLASLPPELAARVRATHYEVADLGHHTNLRIRGFTVLAVSGGKVVDSAVVEPYHSEYEVATCPRLPDRAEQAPYIDPNQSLNWKSE